MPNSNQQQQPPIVQWPCTPQNATEQFLTMHFPTQASPPGALNQWQQFQYQQVFAQTASSFWQPQPPGANVPSFFQPFTDTGFQGGPSSTIQTLLPNMSCHYTFPGFPHSWDPPSYMAQLYQMQHPYVFSFPGAPNFSSATPKVPDRLASVEHSSQNGIMRPPSKLSQKHQQLWEAQSAENVKLWSVINKLQAEVSDYNDRLKKLEEEVSSFKKKAEVPTNKVIGTIPVLTVQPKKRGGPKRSLASVDPSYESHLPAGGKKPALSNYLYQSKSPFGAVKSPIFEKVILKKVENKEITTRSTTTMVQHESNVNILNAVKDVSCNTQINQSNPIMSACQGQVPCGNGVNVNFGKDHDLKVVYSEPSQPDKVLKNSSMGVSAKSVGNTGNGNVGLTSCAPSQDTAKDMLDVARRSFFHNGSFIQQGGNITPGWSLSFANEEDA
ncbi:hypothetical protein AAZX31_01G184000 [Glycine max]|nr:hypothetical protein JHK85_002386 [Glycine max]KAG5089713.1 hypothetical protein JHK86_002325 [Glycine max]KAH1163961.1 hypothetical protein GYH30_002141 [Glycine max]KRH77183.1 hypothetical protein GLYMA_01G197400v4 [Glycine max]